MEEVSNTADSVESCPVKNYENLFVCSTYELISSSQQRIGSFHLFQVKSLRFTIIFCFIWMKN